MKEDLLRAFSGEGKYLFVSYAHKDSADVLPAIEALAAAGCRVWYDEGIEAGDDWAGKIGSSLEKASAVLFFASKSSVTRENVLRELSFAKERGIPVLTAGLGRVSLPDELQRMLLTEQIIDLSSCGTYGGFVSRIRPFLERHGVLGEKKEDIPDRPVAISSGGKGRRAGAAALAVIAVLALAGFAAFRLLFAEVPSVVGLPAAEAQKEVEEADFDCTVSLNYSDEYEYGVIFEQSVSGRSLKMVPVVIKQSLGPEEDLTDVPDTVGSRLSSGAAMLVEAGMTKFRIKPVETAGISEEGIGVISAQSIPAGLRVSKNNMISLDVRTDGGEISVVINGRVLTLSGTEEAVIDFDELPEYEPEPETEYDEYGMTPGERAYWDALVVPFFRGENRKGYPFVDAQTLMNYEGSPVGGVAYIARDMTVTNEPSWADMYSEYIVPPGVTLTLEGSKWRKEMAFVVMKGGTLIINGNVNFQYGVNHGTLIVNGSLNTPYQKPDSWGNQWGELGNDGRIVVNGSCTPSQLWSYAGGSVTGTVNAGKTVDRSGESAPAWANGPNGFGTLAMEANGRGEI